MKVWNQMNSKPYFITHLKFKHIFLGSCIKRTYQLSSEMIGGHQPPLIFRCDADERCFRFEIGF